MFLQSEGESFSRHVWTHPGTLWVLTKVAAVKRRRRSFISAVVSERRDELRASDCGVVLWPFLPSYIFQRGRSVAGYNIFGFILVIDVSSPIPFQGRQRRYPRHQHESRF